MKWRIWLFTWSTASSISQVPSSWGPSTGSGRLDQSKMRKPVTPSKPSTSGQKTRPISRPVQDVSASSSENNDTTRKVRDYGPPPFCYQLINYCFYFLTKYFGHLFYIFCNIFFKILFMTFLNLSNNIIPYCHHRSVISIWW